MLAGFNAYGQSGIITTIAGTDLLGFSGDGGPATAAQLYETFAVAADRTGNIYISDAGNLRVRKISPDGIIKTIAGNGSYGFSGDGGAATAAELFGPGDIAVDGLGNIYIVEVMDSRIRKVNSSGIISTFAGNGISGFSGDGGAATAAEFSGLNGIALDASGNVYIADGGNSRIRKINSSGIISTIAGNGTPGFGGDGGMATAAQLSPYGVTIDAIGNIYIADFGNSYIRKISVSGIISTLAGSGSTGFTGDSGAATDAELSNPVDVKVDGIGNIYIADYGNNRVRKINSSGIISTIAGNGTGGYSVDGIQATASELYLPTGLALDTAKNIYIADDHNSRIRKINLMPVAVCSPPQSIPPSLFPNPATEEATIKTLSNNYTSFTITSIMGQQVLYQPITGVITKVNVKALPVGVYYVTFMGEVGEAVVKFVKM